MLDHCRNVALATLSSLGLAGVGAAGLTLACIGATSASAQVRYSPYATPQPYTAPTPYGYPVPSGYLQPNETLGTSPSFEINPYARYGQPVVTVVQRCQYPNGWNITDFDRDLNGIPAGVGHTCPAPASVRARY